MSAHQSPSLALSILLACSTAVIHYVGAQSTMSTVYILPAPTSPCPGEGPCFTIDQYVSNSSLRDGISDIIMQLQPGYHNLSVPFTINTQNTPTDSGISSIMMIGTSPVDVTLLCTEEFSFNFMNRVRISGINLVNCGGPSTHIRNVTDFTLEDSTFQSDMPFRVRLSANPVIVNSVFSNCTNGALSIRNGRPMIQNCTFSNNVKQRVRTLPGDIDGGVIYFNSVNAFIDRCTFENNSANLTSGVIYITIAELNITNSNFINNTAIQSNGGAIDSFGGTLFIEDSSFTNNRGDNGGAINVLQEDDSVIIRRCEFVNNTAVFEGGAVQIFGRLVHTMINNSRFIGNTASQGGAVLKRGSRIFFSTFQSTYVNNLCSNVSAASGALYFIASTPANPNLITVTQSIFVRNTGYDGAVGVVGSNYSVTVQGSIFMENVATNSGGAIVSSSSGFSNITIRDSEFNRNSAPQCGALDLNADSMNPNFQLRTGLNVKVIASTFTSNTATVNRGGALCASNSVLVISGASFSGNSARSGGDAIHACGSEVNVESSGLSSESMDGQCLLYNNGGVPSHAINLMLFSFMTLVVLMNTLY